jgi:O-antigen ligase
VTQKNLQKKSALAIGGLLVMGLLFFYQDLYDLILKVSMLDMRTQDIAGRGQVWLLGLESIKTNPFTGLGFWVNPMGLSIPEHFPLGTVLGDPALEIHNAFIRIATENGLVLLAMILALMGIAAYRLHRDKNYLELAVIMGVTFFLFFSTRHLTLNLMNILLYTVILKAMMLPKPRKMLKITKRRKVGND